jgi:hypothetical protein
MTSSQLAAVLGFLFVAAWVALDFGDAVLCLLGAAVFYVVTAVYRGEIDMLSLQQQASSTPRAFGRSRVR